MDWDKRNMHLVFYRSYIKYLTKASKKLTDVEQQQLYESLKFSPFEKSAFTFILKETICKLSIVNRGLSYENKWKKQLPTKPPMEIRFKEHNLDKLYDERTLQPLRECLQAISNSKLENDIEVIRCAVLICLNEFKTFERFTNFTNFICSENREAYDEYNLLKMYSENEAKLVALSERLIKSRQENENLISQLDDELFRLKATCEDSIIKHQLENNMVKKWEKTRQEQVEAVFSNEIKTLSKMQDDFENKTERELIAINEVTSFYRLKCEELETSIASWKRRYEGDKMELDERIKRTQDNIEDVKSKHQLIQSWYEKRDQFIENYWVEQQELLERKKLEEKQCEAAIHIQAWWRGTMVRKQLGPYRPKKKNKKAKSGKKK